MVTILYKNSIFIFNLVSTHQFIRKEGPNNLKSDRDISKVQQKLVLSNNQNSDSPKRFVFI